MKIKDYIRLSSITLKSKKKQTSNTIKGIVFGLTLLITLFFVLFAFYGGTMEGIKKEKTVSSFIIHYKTSNHLENNNNKTKDEIINNHKIEDNIIYKSFGLQYSHKPGISSRDLNYPTIIINNIDYLYDYSYREDYIKSNDLIHFFDLDSSTNLITQAEEKFLKERDLGQPILAGNMFSEDNEEVIVSSQLLDYFNISYEEAIGKTISYKMPLLGGYGAYTLNGYRISEDYNNLDITVFKDYKIIGVFNTNLYLSPSRGENIEDSPTFWFKDSSLYDSDISIHYINHVLKGYKYNKDPLDIFSDAIKQKKVMIPYGFNFSVSAGNDVNYIYDFSQLVQLESFESAISLYDTLDYYETKSNDFSFWKTSVFYDYIQLYPLIMIISITFLTFGGIVFFATILNIYNTMRYSIEKRKSYLAMCKAIGMTNKDILKLYFAEIVLILFKSMIWVIIYSSILCIGMTLIINTMISNNNIESTISYKFNLIYYPIVLFISIFVVYIIATVISILVCNNNKKYSLVDLLKD